MEHSKWRPSPGTVLGVLALVVAVAGTAIAGPLATTSVLSKGEKKQVRKIAKGQANKQIDQRASDFTPAEEVHSPGRLVVNDPTPGGGQDVEANLFVAGVFTVRAYCAEGAGGDPESAALRVLGPAGSSFAAVRTNTTPTNQVGQNQGAVTAVTDPANAVGSGHLIAVAPNGQVLRVTGSVEVNDSAGDCVFGVTAIGP